MCPLCPDHVQHAASLPLSASALFYRVALLDACLLPTHPFSYPVPMNPLIQIASMVTVLGESKPRVKNIMTLGSCAAIVGAEVCATTLEGCMAYRSSCAHKMPIQLVYDPSMYHKTWCHVSVCLPPQNLLPCCSQVMSFESEAELLKRWTSLMLETGLPVCVMQRVMVSCNISYLLYCMKIYPTTCAHTHALASMLPMLSSA